MESAIELDRRRRVSLRRQHFLSVERERAPVVAGKRELVLPATGGVEEAGDVELDIAAAAREPVEGTPILEPQ